METAFFLWCFENSYFKGAPWRCCLFQWIKSRNCKRGLLPLFYQISGIAIWVSHIFRLIAVGHNTDYQIGTGSGACIGHTGCRVGSRLVSLCLHLVRFGGGMLQINHDAGSSDGLSSAFIVNISMTRNNFLACTKQERE